MTSTSGIGLYHPGSSVLHRIPAGVKLVGMLAVVAAILIWHSWWQLAIGAGAIALLFAAGRIPLRVAGAQLWPLRYVILVLAALQWWLAGWPMAVTVCGTIVVTVAAASLVTLTTRVSAMVDALTAALRPLRRVGVDPDRVGLLLAVTIRCIPVVAGIVDAVTEARKARGLGFSLAALAVPVVVRSLRAADALGDALIARGADD